MMDTSDVAVRAIQEVLNITNACLMGSGGIRGERKREKIVVPVGDDVYIERRNLGVLMNVNIFTHSDWYYIPHIRTDRQHISVRWWNVFFSWYWN